MRNSILCVGLGFKIRGSISKTSRVNLVSDVVRPERFRCWPAKVAFFDGPFRSDFDKTARAFVCGTRKICCVFLSVMVISSHVSWIPLVDGAFSVHTPPQAMPKYVVVRISKTCIAVLAVIIDSVHSWCIFWVGSRTVCCFIAAHDRNSVKAFGFKPPAGLS